MKQGGNSWKNSHRSKSGVQSRFKCQLCGRQHKMEHAKNSHQNSCKTYSAGKLR